LKEAKIEYSISPLFNAKYVDDLYLKNRRVNLFNPIIAYFKRILKLLFDQNYDLLWIEKEALPWLPTFVETFLYKQSVPYVIDYDDAVFHRYDQHTNFFIRSFLSKKIERIMVRSSLVVAGNQYIADYAQRAGAKKVEILPTVLDLSNYSIKETVDPSSYIIGWVGSPITSRYINIATKALNIICQKPNVEFRAIGAFQKDLDEIPGKRVIWNSETESEELTRFDLGIMPLPDTPWERGKCGFKLIQYMASGLPVIASPVGVNCEIVDHGENGFLARDTKQWVKYFQLLIGNQELSQNMGSKGRKKVEDKYSLDVIAPRLISILEETTKS